MLDEIKVNWISSDVPNAEEIKERYEGFTIGEIAAREHKHSVDAMLDLAVAGDLKVGFATRLLETPPESMKEIATSPVALPGVSDGGAHTKFVTTARYPTELLQLLGARARDHVARRSALAPLLLPGRRGRA